MLFWVRVWRFRLLLAAGVIAASTLSASQSALAQSNVPGEWTWVGGSKVGQQAGLYGTQSGPAAANIPGGRQGAATWVDSSGNFWLFGGNGIDSAGALGYLNDLWEFNPSTNQWAWISGSSTSNPAGVYGKQGSPAGGNVPGGRTLASTWIDSSGQLWLFGGYTQPPTGGTTDFNDLWVFNPSTGLWAWMGGSSTYNSVSVTYTTVNGQAGVYGAKGTPAATSTPGSRYGAAIWTDASGHVWLFGGRGFDSKADYADLNDLWELDLATGQWTWLAGSSTATCSGTTCTEPGVDGTEGAPSAANTPGGRTSPVTWNDSSGNLWLFGGHGDGSSFHLDDLWTFNPSTSAWTWIAGTGPLSSDPNSNVGLYGTEGVFAPGNYPSARYEAAAWIDESGNPWLFGGNGYQSSNLNDLWQYDPATSQWAWMSGSTKASCGSCTINGVYGTLGQSAAPNVPGGRTQPASWRDNSGNLWLFGGDGFDSRGGNSLNQPVMLNDLWEYATPQRPALPTFNLPPGTYSSPQTVTISDATPGVTIHYTTDGSTPTANAVVYSGLVPVSHTGTIQAMATAPGYNSSGVSSASYVITWPTTTTLTAPGGQFVYGQGTTLVVNVTSAGGTPPDGAFVQLIQDGTKVLASGGLVNGTAIIPVDWFPGSYSIAATYIGTASFLPSTSSTTVFTSAPATTTTTLTSSVNPQPFGQAVTFTATVTPQFSEGFAPGGTVTFYNGTTPLAPVFQQSGPFTLTTSAGLLQGTNPISAVYSANNLYLPSTSNVVQQATTPEVTAGFQWTWMGGDSTYSYSSQPGVYDTLGVPNLENIPAAGRSNAATWTDQNGNLWLFGGGQSYYEKNDFWEFTPSTNMWTWMGGTPQITCQPVPNSDLCTYGVAGVYNAIGVPEWYTYPGNRQGPVSWTDASGNFWLFGGEGYGKTLTPQGDGLLNDLWQYNPTTGLWTWMSGSEWLGQFGVYGTQGKPSTGNVPGARTNASGWIDSQGHLWLFGGRGFDAIGLGGGLAFLNDLWEFDPSTSEWTWVSGLSVLKCAPDPEAPGVCDAYAPATYGTRGKFSASNTPGSRNWGTSWTDANGHFWLFGGVGYQVAPAGTSADCCYLNELWEFDPGTKQWAWMGGSTTPQLSGTSAGNYGTFGVPDAANTPGGRYNAAGWRDRNGNLWLFGGYGFDSNENEGPFNDLWEFSPSTLQWAWMGGASTLIGPLVNWWSSYGAYGTLGVPAAANTPGGRQAPATWVGKSGNFWLFSGQGYDPTGAGVPNDLWMFQPNSGSAQAAASKITITSPAANTVYGQAITLSAAVTSTAGPPPDGESVEFFNGPTNVGSGVLSSGTASFTTTTLAAGTDPVVAVYGGDPNFARAISAPVTQTVAVAPTSTSLTINPVVVVSSFGNVTFSGWVTGEYGGAPTETVTIMIGSTKKWSGNLDTGQFAGRYGLLIDPTLMPTGTYSMTVAYSGDANFAPSTSPPVEVMVATLPAGLAVYVVPQLKSLTLQQTDNVSVFVSAGNVLVVPTGTVTLTGGSFSARQTLSGGGTTFAVPALMLNGGTNTLTATYSGDSMYSVASGTATVNVSTAKQPQTITFPALATPLTYGAGPVTLGATASSGLAVTFTATGPASVNGNMLTITGAGAVTVTASQAGNAIYSAATPVSHSITVNKATSAASLLCSETSGAYGASVTLTTKLSNAGSGSAEPTGTVTFFSGATSLGTGAVNASGVATLTLNTLAVGTDSITASYGGNANYAAAKSSAFSITVGKAAQTINFTAPASPVAYGISPIKLVATASSNLAVTFTVASGSPATVSGSTLTITGVDSVVITASQAGNADYAAAPAAHQTIVVSPGTATGKLTSSAASVTYGASVTLTATFTGSGSSKPSGTVTFLSGSTFVGTGALSASGVATLALATLPAGTDSLTASFPGDTRYGAVTTAPITETVKQATPTVKLTSSASTVAYGASVTLTATLAGAGAKPTGTVTFLSGTTTLGTGPVAVNSSGVTTLAVTILPVGAYSIKASYGGDTNYAAATSTPTTVTITKAAQPITFTAPTTPVTYGVAPITPTATASSGLTVTFTATGPATVNGNTLAITGAGSVTVTANEAGNGNYKAATAVSKTITVNKATPTVSLVSSATSVTSGTQTTFTATVGGAGSTAPTGTVTFLDGTTTLGTGTLASASATYSSTKLAVGKHSITARYAGDSNYVTATSSAVSLTVAAN